MVMNPIVGVYIFFMVGIPGIKDGMTKLIPLPISPTEWVGSGPL